MNKLYKNYKKKKSERRSQSQGTLAPSNASVIKARSVDRRLSRSLCARDRCMCCMRRGSLVLSDIMVVRILVVHLFNLYRKNLRWHCIILLYYSIYTRSYCYDITNTNISANTHTTDSPPFLLSSQTCICWYPSMRSLCFSLLVHLMNQSYGKTHRDEHRQARRLPCLRLRLWK